MADAQTRTRRWFQLTPDRLVHGLLAVEGLLFLSERFQWFAFNEHKGWTVLIAVASLGVAMLLMLAWFAAGLEHLKGLTQLQMLHVYGTKVTDEGVRGLHQALPKCQIVREFP
jgi:hypothetical protein